MEAALAYLYSFTPSPAVITMGKDQSRNFPDSACSIEQALSGK